MELKISKKDKLDRLALRMKKGDRAAASALYDELAPKVYGFMFSRTGKREIAEDLSQQVFLRLIEKIETFDGDRGRFVVWFWQMARNMLIDHYREKRALPFSSYEEDEVEAMAVTEMPDVDARVQYEKLQAFLKLLDDGEREVFEMRFAAEMSYKEMASLLGRSEGSLRIAAMRVKEKIKKHFKNGAKAKQP